MNHTVSARVADAADRRLQIAFFAADGGSGWVGGANYLSNLLTAIANLPDRRIAIVLFVPAGTDVATLARFPADRIVPTPLVLPRHPLRLLGKLLERAWGRNLLLERLLRREGIDLVSHALPAGRKPKTSTLTWIADFQELHIPGFFSQEELAQRSRGHALVAEAAHRILLSSEDAQHDLATILPEALPKSRVLRFVSGLSAPDRARDAGALRDAYRLDGPFFHLPNQFWIHKNHGCVIEALAILRAAGTDVTVICTGHTADYRHPDHFASVEVHARQSGVADLFRIEGLVPYADVAGFMRDSVAVINPSLFEGWSTTVEEAKAQGKLVLLSDIGVHREQAPARCRYFAPNDPHALAAGMMAALRDFSPEMEETHRQRAAAAQPERLRAFAHAYQAIVLEACGQPPA